MENLRNYKKNDENPIQPNERIPDDYDIRDYSIARAMSKAVLMLYGKIKPEEKELNLMTCDWLEWQKVATEKENVCI